MSMHTAADNEYEHWVDITSNGPSSMSVRYRGHGYRGRRGTQDWTGTIELTR